MFPDLFRVGDRILRISAATVLQLPAVFDYMAKMLTVAARVVLASA